MDGFAIFDASNYALSLYALAPMAVGALIAAMGVFVLVREKFSTVSMAFSSLTVGGAAWLLSVAALFCSVDPALTLTWCRIEGSAVILIPSVVFLFSLAVTNRLYHHRVWALASFGVSAVFCFLALFTDAYITGVRSYFWGPYPRYGWASLPFLAFFFGTMAASLLLFARGYRSAPSEVHRRRLRSFLAAFSIAYIGSVDFLPAYGVPIYPFGYLPVLVFLVIVARTIWRYQLVDITPAFAANQILRTMSDALLVLDRDGIIRVANQAAGRLFGLPEAGLVGRPVWTVHGGLFPKNKLQTFIRTSVVHGYEISYRTAQKADLVLDVSASGIRDAIGRPMAVVCILRDVTQRRQREEELRKAHEDLQQSHEELKAAQLHLIESAKLESVGRLAAGVAHEVKNPLAVVLQGLDYLQRVLPGGDKNLALVLENGQEAVRRADKVIRGLLDFSSVRALEIREGSLNAVLEQALLLVRHELESNRVQLVKELQESLPPLPLDANKMEQLFVNVLMNAVQAMPWGGGTLTVRTRTLPSVGNGDSEEAVIAAEIEDEGGGIPVEALPRIFEPFYTTKPTGSGTGLGLAVCKNIVEMHGGAIHVQNRPDHSGVRVIVMMRAGRAAARRESPVKVKGRERR